MKERAVIGAATTGVNEVANRGLWNVTELRRQVRVLVGPYQRDGIELPDVIVHGHIYLKAAQDIHVIVIHGETAWDEILITGWPVSRHGADGVSDRVITENPPRGGLGGNLRAAYAVDVWGPVIGEYATGHVIDLVIRVGGCPGCPSVGEGVIFKRMYEIAACHLGAAPAHAVKPRVGREKDANHAHGGTWEIRAGFPTARRAN
jgi:hypothetical protein